MRLSLQANSILFFDGDWLSERAQKRVIVENHGDIRVLHVERQARMHHPITTAPARTALPQEKALTVTETLAPITTAIAQFSATATVALVAIHFVYKTAGKQEPQRAQASSQHLLEVIRPLARKTDQVFLHQQTGYVVLPGADLQGAEIVEERLWEALLNHTRKLAAQEELLCPVQLTIGHGALPEPQRDVETLLHAAREVSRHFRVRPIRSARPHYAPVSGIDESEAVAEGEHAEISRLARKLGIPYLTLLPRKLPPRVLQSVNARLARELRCYPLGRERNMLTVAMLNPQDHQTLERLHQETGLSIYPVLTHQEALDNALKQLS
jgi:hypothetical protein